MSIGTKTRVALGDGSINTVELKSKLLLLVGNLEDSIYELLIPHKPTFI